MPDDRAIRVEDLTRVFRVRRREAKGQPREIVALSGVSLDVDYGELFGVLGPNGAWKTTLIKILSTLLAPTSGRAFVAGVDVMENPWEIRRHINMVSGGESSDYGLPTVEGNLWMFSQFYEIDTRTAQARIRELLGIVGLSDRRRTKIFHLSTGMRRKMSFVRGFLTEPEILFLDEPTLGLDVQTARVLPTTSGLGSTSGNGGPSSSRPTRCTRPTSSAIGSRSSTAGRSSPATRPPGWSAASSARRSSACESDRSPTCSRSSHPSRRSHGSRRRPARITPRFDVILANENALAKVLGTIQENRGHLLSLEKREPTLEDVFLRVVGYGFEEAEEKTP